MASMFNRFHYIIEMSFVTSFRSNIVNYTSYYSTVMFHKIQPHVQQFISTVFLFAAFHFRF